MLNLIMSTITMLVLGCWIATLIALSIIVLARLAKMVVQEFYSN